MMFAKLKKKIENEGGLVSSHADSPGKSTGRRESVTSLPRAGSIQHLGVSPPGSFTGDSFSMQDESVSRDEIVCLLQKKSEQCKKLEGNISDLAALVKDKSKTIEKLETALRQQEENTNTRLLEQKEEFEKFRDKLIECHQDEKFQLGKLLNIEKALTACQSELRAKTIQCVAAETKVEKLTSEVGALNSKMAVLESEIQKLEEENRKRANLVTSLSKDKAALEKKLEEVNKEIEEKQIQLSWCQMQLANLDEEFKSFVSHSDLQRSKTSKLLQEKDDHIDNLRERVKILEQRISDFSLSGDDQLNALQVERDQLEQKLSETRHQLTEVRSTLCEKISHLEDQISHLNTRIVENNDKLAASHRINDQLRESFQKQVEDLRSKLEEAEKRAIENLELASSKETHYKKQIEELENEMTKQKFKALDSDTHFRAKVDSLDMQIKELENSRKIEKEEAKSRIIHMEEQAAMFADKEIELEGQVSDLEESVSRLQGVILEKDMEIDSLTLTIQNREMTGSDQNGIIVKLQQQISEMKLKYDHMKEERDHLEKHKKISEEEKGGLIESSADLHKQIQHLKSINSESKLELERLMNLKSETEATLRQKFESLEQMVKQEEISKTESGLHSEKLEEMSKTISSLQTQLAEKSRTMKKQEQTLKDLRVTLQRELKVQSLPNDEALDATNSSNSSIPPTATFKAGSNSQPSPRQQEPQQHYQQKQYLHQQSYRQSNLLHGSYVNTSVAAVLSVPSSPSNMMTLTATSSSVPSGATDALTIRTDTVRRELDKDINFLYLKHVILKFMLSRESEAVQLIKAVSMLLNFTHQEQQLIKDTLEYKMSWFGHRPSLGEGQTSKIIPPAL